MVAKAVEEIISLAADGESCWCATFESSEDKSKWCQFTWDNINAAYPFIEEPSSLLVKKGLLSAGAFEVSSFEKNSYLTLSHDASSVEFLSGFIKSYFALVLGVEASNLKVRMETL